MSINLPEQKAALRRQLRDQVRQIPLPRQAELSAEINKCLLTQSVWQTARTVMFFVPTVGEPDVAPLVEEAWSQGKKVILPSFSRLLGQYEGRVVNNLKEDLHPGQFGILEPQPGCSIFDLKQLDLALVPGIGFTLNGGRLGRGKGFYDRLLAEISGFKCGVAFDCQVVDVLPLEFHDVQLNCILTPTRWHTVVRSASVLK